MPLRKSMWTLNQWMSYTKSVCCMLVLHCWDTFWKHVPLLAIAQIDQWLNSYSHSVIPNIISHYTFDIISCMAAQSLLVTLINGTTWTPNTTGALFGDTLPSQSKNLVGLWIQRRFLFIQYSVTTHQKSESEYEELTNSGIWGKANPCNLSLTFYIIGPKIA